MFVADVSQVVKQRCHVREDECGSSMCTIVSLLLLPLLLLMLPVLHPRLSMAAMWPGVLRCWACPPRAAAGAVSQRVVMRRR